MADFINPIIFVFYSEVGKFLAWLFKRLPFSASYSFKLIDLASSFNKRANDLLLEDINREKIER